MKSKKHFQLRRKYSKNLVTQKYK